MRLFLVALLLLCFCGRASVLERLIDALEMELSQEEELSRYHGHNEWNGQIGAMIHYTEGNCDKGAIIGRDGKKLTNDDPTNALKITDAEAKTIGNAFTTNDFSTFKSAGFRVDQHRFHYVSGNSVEVLGDSGYGNRMTLHSMNTNGFNAGLILLCHTPPGLSQGTTNKGVAKFAADLELHFTADTF